MLRHVFHIFYFCCEIALAINCLPNNKTEVGVDLFMHCEKPRKDRLATGHATQKNGDTMAFYITEHGELVNIPRFFFFFSRRYNPWWVLACFTISFHNLLSLHFSLQFLTFIFFKFSSTWSSHLSLGLPTGLDEHVSHSVNFLTVIVVSIPITCAAQRNLCDFINIYQDYAV